MIANSSFSVLKDKGALVYSCPEPSIGWVIEELASQGHRTILCEGGGRFLRALIESQLLDRLYLTLCPIVLGSGPSLVDGQINPQRLILESTEVIESEIFLTYRFR